MDAPLSQKDLLNVMADCSHCVDADSWEQILELFAARLATVSTKLTAVELASLLLIGAAIAKRIRSESVPAKLIVFRRVERRMKPRLLLRPIG